MNDPGSRTCRSRSTTCGTAAAKAVEYGGEIIEASDIGLALFIRDPDGQLLELLPATYRDRPPPKP